MPKPKITYTLTSSKGNENQIDEEDIKQYGMEPYAEANPGATIRMRDDNNDDYDIPLKFYNDALQEGLHPFRIEHTSPKSEEKPAQEPSAPSPESTMQAEPQETQPEPVQPQSSFKKDWRTDIAANMAVANANSFNSYMNERQSNLGKAIKERTEQPIDTSVNLGFAEKTAGSSGGQDPLSVDGQLSNAYKDRERINQALKKREEELKRADAENTGFFARLVREAAQGTRAGMDPNLLSGDDDRLNTDDQYLSLMAAARKNQEQIYALENEKSGKNNNFWRSYGQEFGKGYLLSPINSYRDSYALINAAGQLPRIQKKIESGEALTEEEKSAAELVNQYSNNEVAQNLYASKEGAWSRAGKTAAGAVDFMVSLALTPGWMSVANVTKDVITKVGGKYLAKSASDALAKSVAKAVGRGLVKMTGITAGSLAAGAYSTNMPTGASKVAKSTAENYYSNGLEDLGSAFAEAERSWIGENATEALGSFLPGGGVILKGFEKLGLSKISNFMRGLGSKKFVQQYNRVLEATGLNSVPGEAMEEYANFLYDAMTGHSEEAIKAVKDPKTHIDIWLGCLTTGVLLRSVPMVAEGYHTGQHLYYKHQLESANKNAVNIFDYSDLDWEEIRDKLDDTENGDMSSVVSGIIRGEGMSREAMNAVIDYAGSLMKFRAHNILEIENANDAANLTPESVAVNNGIASGHELEGEERAVVQDDYLLAKQEAEEIFGSEVVSMIDEDPIGAAQSLRNSLDWSEAEERCLMNYLEKKSMVTGMDIRIEEEVSSRVSEAESVINKQTNVEDGMVHPAKNANDGSKLYIVSGKVATNEDGTVNREASDDTIVVVDENGKKSMVPASSLSEIEQPIPADQLKEESAANIRKEYEQKERDQINGVVTPQPGMVISLQGDDGTYNVSVVGEDGQGNVVVDMGGQQFPIPYDTFQEAAKTAKLSERKAYLQEQSNVPAEQAETEVSPEAQEEVQATEAEAIPADETVEQPTEVEQPQTAIDMIPKEELRDSRGKTKIVRNFEAVDPETTYNALFEVYGDDGRVQKKVSNRINKIDSEIKAVQKQLQKLDESDDFDADIDNAEGYMQLQDKLNNLTASREYWTRVSSVPEQMNAVEETGKQEETTPVVEQPLAEEPVAESPVQESEAEPVREEVSQVEESKPVEEVQPVAGEVIEEPVAESPITEKPVEGSLNEKVKEAEANTNQNPTEAQIEAGNYKKGHVTIGDFDITIENPAGSTRSGKDANGKEWSVTMANTYGYIRGTEGVDGDHIDVFLSNDMDGWNGGKVFVVDQTNTDGSFDEHKCMLGFNSLEEAEAAYYANYSTDWKKTHPGIRITGVSVEDFAKWVQSSHRKTKPFDEYSAIKQAERKEGASIEESDNSQKKRISIKKKYNNENAGLERSQFTDQLEEAEAIDKMAKLLGVKVKFTDETGPGDAYISGDTVYIKKGNYSGEKTLKFLVGHEFTHRMQDVSPEAYEHFKAFAKDFMGDEWEAARNATKDAYDRYNEYARENGLPEITLSEDEIDDEVTADFAGRLADEQDVFNNFVHKLESEKEGKSIMQKIRDFFNRIKDFFTGKAKRNIDNAIAQLESLISQSAKEIAENRELINEDERVFNDTPKSEEDVTDIRYSFKKFDDMFGQVQDYFNRHYLGQGELTKTDKSRAPLRKNINQNDINEAYKVMSDFKDFISPYIDLEHDGKRYLPAEVYGKSTIFTDSAYGKTMENMLICIRTLAYLDFVNEVKRKLGRPITVRESFLASQMLYDIAVDHQCLYCYVSLDRKAYDEYLLKYIDQRDKTIEAIKAGDKSREQIYKEFIGKRKDTPNMQKRFASWELIAKNGNSLTSDAFALPTKRSEIRNSSVPEAWKIANDKAMKLKGKARTAYKNTQEYNRALIEYMSSPAGQIDDAEAYAQSASWAKKLEEYRSYTGELLKQTRKSLRKIMDQYGLRFYSFSEFSPAFILENMQMVLDASLRGLTGFAYTKETDFIRIFAPSGLNINCSCYGRLNEKGEVEMDESQGANWEEVKQLRQQYPNVGSVFVATNDKIIEWALNQDWIDVIIPFHIVRTGSEVAEFYNYTNYTDASTDKTSDNKSVTIHPNEHHNDKETFLNICKERGIKPRFYNLKLSDGSSVLDHPNYMRLVNETRRSVEETPLLKPVFNLEEAKKSFSNFIEKGGYYDNYFQSEEVFKEGVNQVVEDIKLGKSGNEVEYGRQDIPMDAARLMQARSKKQFRHHNKSIVVNTKENKPSLVGVHNISEGKLRSALKMGGLANPSLAVIDSENQSHEGYGEISLIAPSSLIDKRTGKNAGTYTGDAWTPTYPQVISKFTGKGESISKEDVKKLPEPMQEYTGQAMDRFINNGEGNGLAYMYLSEKGMAPDVVMQKVESSESLMDKIESLGKSDPSNMSDEELESLFDLYIDEQYNGDREKYERFTAIRKASLEKKLEEFSPKSLFYKSAKKELEDIEKYGFSRSKLSSFASKVRADISRRGQADAQSTSLESQKYISENGLESDFEKWQEDLKDRYNVKEYLHNGYTKDGTSKYIPHTLENVSKYMNKEGKVNTKNDTNYSATRSLMLQRLNTLDQIRKNKGKLGTPSDEDIEQIKSEYSNLITELSEEKKLSDNVFMNMDEAALRLQESVQHKDPIAFLNDEYGYEISKGSELEKNINKVLGDLKNLPSKYFETKFNRPVSFNEFSAAVVPDNIDPNLIGALKSNGIEVYSYKAGDNESRKDAFNQATQSSDDILFRKNKKSKKRRKNKRETSKGQDELSDELQKNKEIEQAAQTLAESLGIEVNVIHDINEVTHSNPRNQEELRKAKGWYSTKTGEVNVVIPNAESVEDVQETILHEVVGHKGMREVVGEDNFNDFLDNVFFNADPKTRSEIIDRIMRNGWDARLATEEYIAELSESGFKEREKHNFFQKIGDAFMDLLSKAKIYLNYRINDNDLRYMLWRSYKLRKSKGKEDVFSKAEDIAMQNELGVGNFRARNVFGGNSGYVGYSMSKRAAQARAEGRFPKTDFKKEYGITEKSISMLSKMGLINNSEWHHTSSYGNKTTFYGWDDELYHLVYTNNKKEIDKLSREWSMENPQNASMDKVSQSDGNQDLESKRESIKQRIQEIFSPESIEKDPSVIEYKKTIEEQERAIENYDNRIESLYNSLGEKRKDIRNLEVEKKDIVNKNIESHPEVQEENGHFFISNSDGVRCYLKDDSHSEIYRYDYSRSKNGFISDKSERAKIQNALRDKRDLILSEAQSSNHPELSEIERRINELSKEIYGINSDLSKAFEEKEDYQKSISTEEDESDSIRYRVIQDADKIKELESEPKVKAYRTMQVIDGELYSPMAKKVAGKENKPIKFRWEAADEYPELAIKGDGSDRYPNVNGYYITIDKGQGKGSLDVAYNPYNHTSRTVLNDQFSSAYIRPNLVVVEVEIPQSELEGKYKAEKAKDPVGEMKWHSGSVSAKFAELGNPRKVILTRYDKPVRILTKKEEAEKIAESLKGTGISMPYNLVTPQVREELQRLGIQIDNSKSGSVAKNPSYGKAEYITDEQINEMNNRMQANSVNAPESIRSEAEEISEEFNTPVRFISDKETSEGNTKGWYDSEKGEMVVNLPNIIDVEDVRSTILQALSVKELKELVGESGYDNFLGELLSHSKSAISNKVNAISEGKGIDTNNAMEEYIREVSEKGYNDLSDSNSPVWTKLKESTIKKLDKFLETGILPKSIKLGENEIRYILWKGHHNSNEDISGLRFRNVSVNPEVRRSEVEESREEMIKSHYGSISETDRDFIDGKIKEQIAAYKRYDFTTARLCSTEIAGKCKSLSDVFAIMDYSSYKFDVWDPGTYKAYLRIHPEQDYATRISNEEEDSLSDLQEMVDRLDLYECQIISRFIRLCYNPSEKKTLRKGLNQITKKVDEQKENLSRSNGLGENLNLKKSDITYEEYTSLFTQLNSDPYLNELFEKVMDVAKNLGLKFHLRKFGKTTFGDNFGNIVRLNLNLFNSAKYSNDTKAQTMLHELIHSVTSYAFDIDRNSEYGGGIQLSEAMREAVQQIKLAFNQIKYDKNFKGEYGIKNIHEMMAELSNPSFRQKLQETTIWERIVDAFKKLFGIKRNDMLSGLETSLSYMLENFDQTAYTGYINVLQGLKGYATYSKREVNTLAEGGSFFSGGGLLEEGLKQVLDPKFAVEYDKKISGVYRNNFGDHIVTADVRDVDPMELLENVSGKVQYFHASPVCKNFSTAKADSGELPLDISTAISTAEAIRKMTPEIVTIENVPRYRNSESMKIITDQLDRLGYNYDIDVYDSADYGAYTSRRRMILRAVRSGNLPQKPEIQERTGGWIDVVGDLIDDLKETTLPPWMERRLSEIGIERYNIKKPLYIFNGGTSTGKLRIAYSDQILPTITTMGGDRIIMPDGRVLAVSGRVLARISGIDDDYILPTSDNLSHKIIGNGIPVKLTKAVIAPLIQSHIQKSDAEELNTSDIRFRTSKKEDVSEDTGTDLSGITPDMAKEAVDEVAQEPKTVSQHLTDALVQLSNSHKNNLQVKKDALAEITASVYGIRKAKSAQKAYDKSTVKDLATLATTLIRGGFFDKPSAYEISRIIAAIKNGSTLDNIQKQAEKILDIIISNQLSASSELLQKLSKVKSKVNASGVEVQGKIDARSKKILDVFRNSLFNNKNTVTPENIKEMIADAEERMSSEDSVVSENAAIEWEGLNLANRYMETIRESMAEETELRAELAKAAEDKSNGTMTPESYKEFVESTKEAIRSNQLERIDAYSNLIGDLISINQTGRESAKDFIKEEKERVSEIHHNANSDMEGIPNRMYRREEQTWKQKLANNSILRFLFAPLATFDQMLRMFGSKSVNGEGYLFNRYMPQCIYATGNEYDGMQEAFEILDNKVSELFGKKMKWSDLYAYEKKVENPIIHLRIGGKEPVDCELSQGNALYIYMANKMEDGVMKLRKMGITQKDVDNLTSLIDPRFIELADWLQEYFMPMLRNKYNEVYKRMYGIPMADIENYFPLRILSSARQEDVDISENTDGNNMPSTITSSVIKRRRNSTALDILNTDAFSLVVEHIQEMEHWNAFAEFNRDINTLLSYRHFKNQVLNMTSIYGSGRTLWDTFFTVSQIVAGQYRPAGKKGTIDSFVVNIGKNVTAAKITFRIYTAIKQLLSLPSFAVDASAAKLAKNLSSPIEAWNWSMENLPIFRKRWMGRQAGDSRLMSTDLDWNFIPETFTRIGMTPNAFVDAIAVSIGAKSIYDTKYEKYIEYGYSEYEADRKAKMDATIIFNETQQSNESMFLAPIQLDRTTSSVALTVFRNSSFGYQRQLVDAIRTIYRMTTEKDYHSKSIEFMTKQNIRSGLSEQNALYAAKKEYNRALFHNMAKVAMFGFILQFAWNIGSYLPYMLFGDDDDKKKEMMKDAAIHGMFGSTEGLSGGSIISESLNMLAQDKDFKDYDPTLLPAISDTKRLVQTFGTDYVEGVNGIINLLVQGFVGVNPQSITETAISIYDACGGDIQTTKEATIFAMRVLNVPQSQIDQVYIDEINLSAREAQKYTISELASRYAKYRLMRGSTNTMWMYDEEGKDAALERHKKRFERNAKERILSGGDEAVNESFNQYLDEYVENRKHYTNIQNYRYSDTDKYAQKLEEFMNTPEGKRYAIMMRATGILNHLAGIILDTKDPEVINTVEEKIAEAKKEFVSALESTE